MIGGILGGCRLQGLSDNARQVPIQELDAKFTKSEDTHTLNNQAFCIRDARRWQPEKNVEKLYAAYGCVLRGWSVEPQKSMTIYQPCSIKLQSWGLSILKHIHIPKLKPCIFCVRQPTIQHCQLVLVRSEEIAEALQQHQPSGSSQNCN